MRPDKILQSLEEQITRKAMAFFTQTTIKQLSKTIPTLCCSLDSLP